MTMAISRLEKRKLRLERNRLPPGKIVKTDAIDMKRRYGRRPRICCAWCGHRVILYVFDEDGDKMCLRCRDLESEKKP